MRQLTLERALPASVVVMPPRARCAGCGLFLARGLEGEHQCRRARE